MYKAIRKNDHKSFAVKVIDKIKLGVKKLEMIETEINLMKAVKGHPNIINLEEVYETNNEVFIVMEQYVLHSFILISSICVLDVTDPQ